jgi:hypothetical protein
VMGGERLVGFNALLAYPYNLCSQAGEDFIAVSEGTGFLSTSNGFIFRIEIEHYVFLSKVF